MNTETTLTGITPSGCPFTVKPHSLQYEAHDGVGPVSIPLRASCPLKTLHDELVTDLHGQQRNMPALRLLTPSHFMTHN